jgi:membrane protein DedA with SNARE-associated domain
MQKGGFEMSRITALTLWFAGCVALGLMLAFADGISVLGLAKAAIMMAIIGLMGLLVVAVLRFVAARRKSS